MNVLMFAWRSLVRQRARSTLGILGVAAVGALLFDMLLLSEGLVISMRDVFDRMGFDVRVMANDRFPGGAAEIADSAALAVTIAALPSVRTALPIRYEDVELGRGNRPPVRGSFLGVGSGSPPPWTVIGGRDLAAPRELLLNRHAAGALRADPGATVTVRATCIGGGRAAPAIEFHVAGIAELPFEEPRVAAAATRLASLEDACGTPAADRADFLAVTSAGDPDAAAAEIAALRPEFRVVTNMQVIGQLQQGGFTYFRQISVVLTTVTLAFALLLITVLLTVSVNQRLGEIAALRALGFSQRRLVLDVLCESALTVGIGGLLSLPLGALLARWLDAILKRMPGIPTELHFFVFDAHALAVHAVLLGATALLAAAYPMHIVARLPIAATLRDEVIS